MPYEEYAAQRSITVELEDQAHKTEEQNRKLRCMLLALGYTETQLQYALRAYDPVAALRAISGR